MPYPDDTKTTHETYKLLKHTHTAKQTNKQTDRHTPNKQTNLRINNERSATSAPRRNEFVLSHAGTMMRVWPLVLESVMMVILWGGIVVMAMMTVLCFAFSNIVYPLAFTIGLGLLHFILNVWLVSL